MKEKGWQGLAAGVTHERAGQRERRREKLRQAGKKGGEERKSNPGGLKGEHLSLVGSLAFSTL